MVSVVNTIQKKLAPCREACPAGVDVPRYIRHIRSGRFAEALAVILERIPFPLVCGYACVHPCESVCARQQFDEPVAIRMLKRVAAERGWSKQPRPPLREATGKTVAVVGAGPCGLTAAYYLALQGHAVTVFEASGAPGGMLRYGIPAYRLPDRVVDRDIGRIVKTGVDIRTDQRVEAVEALLEKGFAAVFIASGAWRGLKMGIPGEDASTVLDGLSFLKAVNSGAPPQLGSTLLVVGGGNTAVDAARAGRRLGADVTILYRRSRAEMPAGPEEIEAALEEGVILRTLTVPVRIDGHAVTCIRTRLEAAGEGERPRPVPCPGSEYQLHADPLITAVGQMVEVPVASVDRNRNGTVAVNPRTLASSVPGIFAGGDAVTGPSSIIAAIAQGRKAAMAIDRFLGGDGRIDHSSGDADTPAEAPEAAPRGTVCNRPTMRPVKKRLGSFSLVEKTYDEETADKEAGRCLSCDLRNFRVEVNPAVCKGCGYCWEVCSLDVFSRSDQFNPGGYRPARVVRPERCIGCLRCLYICPDFAITIRDSREE